MRTSDAWCIGEIAKLLIMVSAEHNSAVQQYLTAVHVELENKLQKISNVINISLSEHRRLVARFWLLNPVLDYALCQHVEHCGYTVCNFFTMIAF